MPLNILIAEDAALQGVLTWKEWESQWLAQWLDPLLVMVQTFQSEQTLQQWDQFPSELKDRLEEVNPIQFRKANKIIEDLRKDLYRSN